MERKASWVLHMDYGAIVVMSGHRAVHAHGDVVPSATQGITHALALAEMQWAREARGW